MVCRITQEALARYRDQAAHGRVVVFDTETTGISCFDQIVQLAAVEYVGGARTRTFSAYLVPTCPIHPEAEAVHHLSRAFLEAHGLPPAVALDRFFDFLGDNVLLVAHNIRFDLRMLQNECRAFGYAAEPSALAFCDTLALARRLVPGLAHYRLCNLIDHLGLAGANTHDARDDTQACAALFFALVRRIPLVARARSML